MTTLTPPPLPTDAAPASPRPPRHPAGRAVAITTIVIGALIIGGTLTAGALSAAASSRATSSQSLTASAQGVTEIDVDADAVRLEVRFADVDEASLEVTSARGAWKLERDGDELSVSAPDGIFGWGIGWVGDTERAVLTLPQSLEGVDASFHVGAGELRSDGAFGELEAEVSAGSLVLSGEARTVSATVGAGGADLDLAGVTEARFDISAGEMNARLTGRAPRSVEIDVSAGSLDLALPRGSYDVRSNVDAGDVDNRLSAGSGSGTPVDVRVSAGDVTLRDAD